MPNYDDALVEFDDDDMRRYDFKCCYCGLDGTVSFANWAQLAKDHLLSAGHPSRSDHEYVIYACSFCRSVSNHYFGRITEFGQGVDGFTAEVLNAQRKSFIDQARTPYEHFWATNVADQSMGNGDVSIQMDVAKRHFIENVVEDESPDLAAKNAIIAALQHNKTYTIPHIDGTQFRNAFSDQLLRIGDQYRVKVSDADHCANIVALSNDLSRNFGDVLINSKLRIGTVQKALNLYLKSLWCLGLLPTPPHCPLDGIVLQRVKIKGNWTELDCIETYKTWIDQVKLHSEARGFRNISEWELVAWGI